MPKHFIISPMCSGKTTFAATHPNSVFDIDAARTIEYEPLLRRYRNERDWFGHNSIWYNFCVRPWFITLPNDCTVLVHGVSDVTNLDQDALTQNRVSAVLPTPSEWQRRVVKRKLSDDDTSLANFNYSQVSLEIVKYDLRVRSDFDERNLKLFARGELLPESNNEIADSTDFLHIIDYTMGPFICPVVAVISERLSERPVNISELRKRFKQYDYRALAAGHPHFADPVGRIERSEIWACFLGGWPGILMDAGLPPDQWIPTLAHELAHGIAYLAEMPQSEILANLVGSLVTQFADGLPKL